MRSFAAVIAAGLLAVSCGSGSNGGDALMAETTPPPGLSELVIGAAMPETGTLAPQGIPVRTAIELAVEDIQTAEGRVRLITGDTATDPDMAPVMVERLLGEGAHVIVGALASGISQSFIQTLFDAQIPQCSPTNSSPSFSTQANAAFYFRTAVPDSVTAPALANYIAGRGHSDVAVIARADDWGDNWARLMGEAFADLGVAHQVFSYDEEAPNFDSVITAAASSGADAVLLFSFTEGVQIVRGLLEAGIPPGVMYAGAGLHLPDMPERVDPGNANVVDGLITFTTLTVENAFNDRLGALVGGNVAFGAQGYDCVVVVALAYLAAGSTDGPAIISQIQAVTSGGQKCFDYQECAELLAQGVDFDYDGVSGPIELDEVGDPTWGAYVVSRFQDGVLVTVDNLEIAVADLG